MLTTRLGPAVWHHVRRAWCRHPELVRVQVDGIWYFTCACGYQTPVLRRTAEEAAKARGMVRRDG